MPADAGIQCPHPTFPPGGGKGIPACAGMTRNETMAASEHYDLIIRNATIVDGTKAPRFDGDVAVRNGRIAAVGRFSGGRADREIDATGRIAAPGFIDPHTHDDLLPLPDRDPPPP